MKSGSHKSVGPIFFAVPFILFLVLGLLIWFAVSIGYDRLSPMLTLVRLAVSMS